MEINIQDKVRQLIAKYTDKPEDYVTDDKNIRTDFGADSLSFVEMIMKIEEEFSIEIDEKTAATFEKVGDIIKYIKNIKSKES